MVSCERRSRPLQHEAVVVVLLRRQKFRGGRNLLGAKLVWVVYRSRVCCFQFHFLVRSYFPKKEVGVKVQNVARGVDLGLCLHIRCTFLLT